MNLDDIIDKMSGVHLENFNVSDPIIYRHSRGYQLGILLKIGKRRVKIKNVNGDVVWRDKDNVKLVTDISLKHTILRLIKEVQ